MKNASCFECGQPAEVDHHVIPQVMGGTKTIPLCSRCHSVVHDSKLTAMPHLSKEGKKRVRALQTVESVLEMYEQGVSKKKISENLGISRVAVYGILGRNGLYENTGRGCKQVLNSKVVKDIQKLRRKGYSWDDISKKTGVSRTHLYRVIEELDLYDGKYGGMSKDRDQFFTLTDDQIEKVKKLREQKLTWQQIADTLGVERTTLYRHGIPQQYQSLRGSLTPKKKELAIQLKRQGKTWKEIASMLEVSLGTIYSNQIHKVK